MDPDQLASSEASWSGSTQFSNECISGFMMFQKKIIHIDRASVLLTKLSAMCIICSLASLKRPCNVGGAYMLICINLKLA